MLNELERQAWKTRTKAYQFKPEMALKAVLDQIERGEVKARHIVVVLVEGDDEGDHIKLTQAGDLSQLAVEGVLNRAVVVSRDA